MENTNNTASSEVAQSWESSRTLLGTAKRAQLQPVLAGFDGFVDTILHVVSERRSATEYSRVPTLQAFSEKVLAASGGRNMNIEMVPRLTKIGGNGPILANALAHFDIPVTYIGCLGSPVLHPVFDEFAKKIKTYSIAEPGFSDAIEFADGKLICGKQQAVSEISWKSVLKSSVYGRTFRVSQPGRADRIRELGNCLFDDRNNGGVSSEHREPFGIFAETIFHRYRRSFQEISRRH